MANEGMIAMGMTGVDRRRRGHRVRSAAQARDHLAHGDRSHLAAEGFTRLTYEIVEGRDGVSRLSVIHDLTGTPGHAAMVAGELQGPGEGGGWLWILSDLKSLLESGEQMSTKQGWP